MMKRVAFFACIILLFAYGSSYAKIRSLTPEERDSWDYWANIELHGNVIKYGCWNDTCQYTDDWGYKNSVETLLHTGESEEINSKTYDLYGFIHTYRNNYDLIRSLHLIHIRREGKRVLLNYDEYKAFMQERGFDMTDFDETCQYEVTPDGEIVLYDFNMEVGDKFRSVEGKEDIYVVAKRDVQETSFHANHSVLKEIVLSNGSVLLEDWGFYGVDNISKKGPKIKTYGSFFDYLTLRDGCITELHLIRWDGKFIYDVIMDGGSEGSGINSASNDASLSDQGSSLYDLTGRKLLSQPARGLYIQNGKKIIVK